MRKPESWTINEATYSDDDYSMHSVDIEGPRGVVLVAYGNTRAQCFARARQAAALPEMLAALEAAQLLIKRALPKFNWATSPLDAVAIRLLNEVPGVVDRALTKAKATRDE